MGSVNWNYLTCKGSVIIVSLVHFWEASCVVKEVAKPGGKVVPAIFLMSFECWPLFSPLLERFDYSIRNNRKLQDLQTRQVKCNNQVTDKKNYILQVI